MPLSDDELNMLSPEERADYQANAATMDAHIGAQMDPADIKPADTPAAAATETPPADDPTQSQAAAPAAAPAAPAAPAAAPAPVAAAPAEPDPLAEVREAEAAHSVQILDMAAVADKVARADAIPAEIDALEEKYENGDIDRDQLRAQRTALMTEQSRLNREIGQDGARSTVAAEMNQQVARNTFAHFAKTLKAAGGPDYMNPTVNALLQNAMPQVIDAANKAGETLTFTELYARCHKEVMNVAKALGAPGTAGQPAPTPTPTPQPAKPGAPMGKMPANIGAMPQAQHHEPPASATSDLMNNLESEEYEVAFHKLPEAERQRLLNSW